MTFATEVPDLPNLSCASLYPALTTVVVSSRQPGVTKDTPTVSVTNFRTAILKPKFSLKKKVYEEILKKGMNTALQILYLQDPILPCRFRFRWNGSLISRISHRHCYGQRPSHCYLWRPISQRKWPGMQSLCDIIGH